MNLIPKVKTLEMRDGFLEKNAICFDKDGMDIRLVAALNKLRCDPGCFAGYSEQNGAPSFLIFDGR